MKNETAKAQIKRNTIDRPPRFNAVIISGSIELIDSSPIVATMSGDSATTTIVLDNGIEFEASTYQVKELGLQVRDLILVRGRLTSIAIDQLTGDVHRINTIQAERFSGIRILRKARALEKLESTFPINETVELRGVEYRVEGDYNRESEEIEDLEVFIGGENVTDHLQDLYVKKATGSYTWIVDELYREIVGRRGE